MNCNVHVFCKLIVSNKFGFILETSLFLYLLHFRFFVIYVQAQKARVLQQTWLDRFTREKHYSLLGAFLPLCGYTCYGPSKLECYFTQGRKDLPRTNSISHWAHFCILFVNKCYGPNKSVPLHEAFKVCQEQTLQLIGPINKLRKILVL